MPEGTEEYAKERITRVGGMEPHQCKHLAGRMFIDAILGKPLGYGSLGEVPPARMEFITNLVTQDILKTPKDLWLADTIFSRIVSDKDKYGTMPQIKNEALYTAWVEYGKARKRGDDTNSWKNLSSTFQLKQWLTKISTLKAQYVGNCINSFDPNGTCINGLFSDATQFAQREADARDQDSGTHHFFI